MQTVAPAPSAHARQDAPRETWSSRGAFILAASGSAIGLGNVWKFPYIAGKNGGAAFVLLYLGCVAFVALPLLTAELAIGRRAGRNPVGAFAGVAAEAGRTRRWGLLGWNGLAASALVLSFYSVVAGWALAYVGFAAAGSFSGDGGAAELFPALLASPAALVGLHTFFLALTTAIVAAGVRAGIERASRLMMPGLLVLLIGLAGYAALASGGFWRAAAFLFQADFSKLTWQAALEALGHAFFTLGVGMGVMAAYGSHLPRNVSIGRAAALVAVLDTGVALLAGLAIFPVVFSQGLEPSAGPGLIFLTLPIAFGQISGGALLGTLFFVFLSLAALTSSISLLEPIVEYGEERGWQRRRAAWTAAGAIWALGVGCALAFNVGAEWRLFGKNFFDLLDFTTTNVMLPAGGLAISIFAGRALHRRILRDEVGGGVWFLLWRFAIRYLAPAGVAIVLLWNLLAQG